VSERRSDIADAQMHLPWYSMPWTIYRGTISFGEWRLASLRSPSSLFLLVSSGRFHDQSMYSSISRLILPIHQVLHFQGYGSIPRKSVLIEHLSSWKTLKIEVNRKEALRKCAWYKDQSTV